jgi:hypothetical protein
VAAVGGVGAEAAAAQKWDGEAMTLPGHAMFRARQLAKAHKLHGITYLDKWGISGARGNAVHTIRLDFASGDIVRLTPREMEMLRDVKFNLEKAPGGETKP